jgi:hypothetical protein
MYISGQTPILKGDDALSFNTRIFRFERAHDTRKRPRKRSKKR